MTRLYIVFAGLMGVAEVHKRGVGVVLVRKAENDIIQHGHKIPRHIPSVRYRRRDGGYFNASLSGDVRFVGTSEEGKMTIQSRDKFLDFDDLLQVSGRPTKTKPGCLEASIDSQCASLLAGRVMDLRGDVYPVQIGRVSGKLKIVGEPQIKVLRRYEPEYQRQERYWDDLAANGFLLIADVKKSVVEMRIDEKPHPLGKAASADLERIMKDPSEDAFIVWIENLPENDHQQDHAGPSELTDMHFWLLYDLLIDAKEEDRWVPVVLLPSIPAVVPGSQCITPIMP